ncbi:MAG: cation diffusion facilitator family transporter, partial [Bacteroidales bacterium]|nr:cation diffusion facilitator family transporter [Bacteroidales bacterium]
MTKKKKHPYRLGLIEGWLSIVFNVFLFGLKYWAGIVTGSIAIIADAWHTISDSFSSVIILIGFKLASKPPDKEHPFGHGRAELISSLVVGIILGLIGFNFLTESIVRIKEHQAVEFGNFAIVVMLISIIIKEGMAQYASWASKKIGSKSLKAD